MNLESNNAPERKTDDAEKVLEIMENAPLGEGMVAMSSEGEKKVYKGIDGNPTMPMTNAEYRNYLDEAGN